MKPTRIPAYSRPDRRDTSHAITGKVRSGFRTHLQWMRDRAEYINDEIRAELLKLADHGKDGA